MNTFLFYFLVTQETGISEFLPGAVIDAALFEPCGYSANGLLDVSKNTSSSPCRRDQFAVSYLSMIIYVDIEKNKYFPR